ncbi:MAG: DMT family transporter [Firmicutes bacterium]|nr:DMT family transporter [Bacillota bacterium]
MNSYWSALLIAALAGAAMALQGSLNSVLSKETGLLEATLLVHVIGLAFLGILFALKLNDGNLFDVGRAPWYSFLGGILGVAIIYGVVVAIPRIGVASATTAIIIFQVSTAMLIDHSGLFGLQSIPFNWYKLVGLLSLALGGYLVLGQGK